MGRPSTPILTRERIRATALAIIDRDGLTGLSMRKLAVELGVQAASLYSHVATKEELLHAVANDIMAQVDVSGFENDDWRTPTLQEKHAIIYAGRTELQEIEELLTILDPGAGNR